MNRNSVVIVGDTSYIENEAIKQIHGTMERYSGIIRTVAMPDLHPGPGCPVGCAFESVKYCYPRLIGGDIGCGMTLFSIMNKSSRQWKSKKMLRKLDGFSLRGLSSESDGAAFLKSYDLEATGYDAQLGTIGGGNHFCEILEIENIEDSDSFSKLGLKLDSLLMLVHSGSRVYGEKIVRSVLDKTEELVDGSPECVDYLSQHDSAVLWAKVNRILIALRMSEQLGLEVEKVLDIVHNYLEFVSAGHFIHRKGVGMVSEGTVSVIPGSRGSYSYLVKMTSDKELASQHLNCLAHGAGRRWDRTSAESRMRSKFRDASVLRKTKLGSDVVCESKSLLYQEAPEAYKDIDSVVSDLVSAGLVSVVAVLSPLLTYKE